MFRPRPPPPPSSAQDTPRCPPPARSVCLLDAPHLSEPRLQALPQPGLSPRSGDATARWGPWALHCEHPGMTGSTRGAGAPVASPQVQSSHEKTRGRLLCPLGTHVLPPSPPGSLPGSAAETRGRTRERPVGQRRSTATGSPEKGREKAEAEDHEGRRKERLRFCLQSYLNSCTAFLASPCCSAECGWPSPRGL